MESRLWTSVTDLDFNFASFPCPLAFDRFVTTMLRTRGERPIHSLSLSLGSRNDKDNVAEWLNHALRCGLRKLHF